MNEDSNRYRVRDLCTKYNVKFVVGPKDVKVYFSDTQFLTFDPENVNSEDLENRIAFWSKICAIRTNTNAFDATVAHDPAWLDAILQYEPKDAFQEDARNIALDKLKKNNVYQNFGIGS